MKNFVVCLLVGLFLCGCGGGGDSGGSATGGTTGGTPTPTPTPTITKAQADNQNVPACLASSDFTLWGVLIQNVKDWNISGYHYEITNPSTGKKYYFTPPVVKTVLHHDNNTAYMGADSISVPIEKSQRDVHMTIRLYDSKGNEIPMFSRDGSPVTFYLSSKGGPTGVCP